MNRRRGFTLIEVMVTLVILALAMTLAAGVFSGITRAAEQVGDARQSFDREMNARRWLSRSLRSLEVGTPESGDFLGEPALVSYTSWEPVVDGWTERVPVRLTVEHAALTASIAGQSLCLVDSVRSLAIDYLLVPGATSRWTAEWRSPSRPPLALRLRLAPLDDRRKVDTLLFLIKERG